MQDKPLLLMQTGDAPEYVLATHHNFDVMFLRAADYSGLTTKIVHVARGETLGKHEDYCGVIITGSLAMVTESTPWMKDAAKWIKRAVENQMPLLGVCFGHQLVAKAMGGKVGFHPDGMELGTQKINVLTGVKDYPMLEYLPKNFLANLAHSQTVLKAPDCAKVLGKSRHDPHQILAYGRNTVTVQFHPEFKADVMETIIENETSLADADPKLQKKKVKLLASVESTPVAASVLRVFVNQLSS